MSDDIMERKWGRPIDPTPFEIAAATARIRMSWSETEHRLRAGYSAESPWEPPLGHIARTRLQLDGI
jgi:hypothetical protein